LKPFALTSPAVFVSTFSVGLFADLSTKFAARRFLAEDLPFLGGWITLRHAENPGIAF
jgi:lipoprotein signal peptidase